MTVTATDITAMGFSGTMFGLSEADLISRIEDVIAEQSDLVELRVGETAFGLAANQTPLDRAVKLFSAAEMARARITQLAGNIVTNSAEGAERNHMKDNITAWEKKAEYWLAKVSDGALADAGGFASGCTVSESDNLREIPES